MSVKFDYLHIVFPYDDTLSDRGTTIVNGKKSPRILSISLSTSLCFLLREVKKTLNGLGNDLLRNKVFSFFIDISQLLINLVHILLNVSSKSLENAKYMHMKFRRVCKKEAAAQN